MRKKLPALIISLILFAVTLCAGCTVALFPNQLVGLVAGTMTFEEAVQSGFVQLTTKSAQKGEASSGQDGQSAVSQLGNVTVNTPSADETGSVLMPYYYHLLSEEDRLTYDEVYAVITKHEKDVKITSKDSDAVGKILDYILWDHPEIYYTNSLLIETVTVGNVVSVKVSSDDYMDEATRAKAQTAISSYSANCMNQLSSTMTNYEKAVKIYAYVCSTLQYDANAPYNQSLYSAACGATVCQGYASAFQYLCKEAGIPCIKVTGKMQQENHAWNMVYLDGLWCYVDCTSADALEEYGMEADYSWFGLNASMLSRTHTTYNLDILPQATEVTNLYYYRLGYYFTGYDISNIKSALSSGEDFSFQCASSTVYETYMSQLETSQEVAGCLPAGAKVSFMGSESTLTIFIDF